MTEKRSSLTRMSQKGRPSLPKEEEPHLPGTRSFIRSLAIGLQ